MRFSILAIRVVQKVLYFLFSAYVFIASKQFPARKFPVLPNVAAAVYGRRHHVLCFHVAGHWRIVDSLLYTLCRVVVQRDSHALWTALGVWVYVNRRLRDYYVVAYSFVRSVK